MSNEATTDLVLRADQKFFDEKQVAALRAMGIAQDTKNADLAVFFHQARRTGLDPFAKQIYLMQRRSKNQQTNQWETKSTIQTGIDGYRLIARKAAQKLHTDYDYGPVEWCDSEGNWNDVWLYPGESPIAARVTLYVGKENKQFPAIAHYSEYVQTKTDGTPNSMWVKMAASQLAKCAEALALRKAFPLDLSGIYTEDEMQQADTDLQDLGEMSGEPASEAPTEKVGRKARAPRAKAAPRVENTPEPEAEAPAATPEEAPQEDGEPLEGAPENVDSAGVVDPSTPDPEDPAEPPADYGTPAVLEDLGEQETKAAEPEPDKPVKAPVFKASTPGQFRTVVERAAIAYPDPAERKEALVEWFRKTRQEDGITELPAQIAMSRDEAVAILAFLDDVIAGVFPASTGE